MKFIHLGDLHIGKRLYNYSLIEDQKYIFERIIEESKKVDPDFFIIAGDVFDRPVPSEEAIELYDYFITRLSEIAPIFIIAGNHDSGARLELFKNSLKQSNIFIEGQYTGEIRKETLEINGNKVNLFLIPYISPFIVRSINNSSVKTFHEAYEEILGDLNLNKDEINILIAHQFFIHSETDSEDLPEGSETLSIGGLDEIRDYLIKDFDYAALGHIHGSKRTSEEKIRYSGSPLKYSVNETTKYLNIINLSKDSLDIKKIELKPLRKVREITASFDELMNDIDSSDDYIEINLTDQRFIPNIKKNLLIKFPNLLNIKYKIKNSNTEKYKFNMDSLSKKPIDLLADFFKLNQQSINEKEKELAQEIFKELSRED